MLDADFARRVLTAHASAALRRERLASITVLVLSSGAAYTVLEEWKRGWSIVAWLLVTLVAAYQIVINPGLRTRDAADLAARYGRVVDKYRWIWANRAAVSSDQLKAELLEVQEDENDIGKEAGSRFGRRKRLEKRAWRETVRVHDSQA